MLKQELIVQIKNNFSPITVDTIINRLYVVLIMSCFLKLEGYYSLFNSCLEEVDVIFYL